MIDDLPGLLQTLECQMAIPLQLSIMMVTKQRTSFLVVSL